MFHFLFGNSRHFSRRSANQFRPVLEPLGERCLPSASPHAACACEPDQPHDVRLSGAGQILGDPTDLDGAPFQAAGHATYLGAWENQGTLIVAADGSAHGDVTFEAANGDLLVMDFTGQLFPDGHAVGTFVIDPGPSTGRFDHATGELNLELQQDFQTGAFTFTLKGPISFCASDQSGKDSITAAVFSSRSAMPLKANGSLTEVTFHGNERSGPIAGIATQLGSFTGFLDTRVTRYGAGETATGTLTLVTADGDQLTLSFEIVRDRGADSFVGTFSVVSSTGRFAGATGQGSMTLTPQPDLTASFTLDGSISL